MAKRLRSLAPELLRKYPQLPETLQYDVVQMRPIGELLHLGQSEDRTEVLESTKRFLAALNDELLDHLGIYELTVKDLLCEVVALNRKEKELDALTELEQENKTLKDNAARTKGAKDAVAAKNKDLTALIHQQLPKLGIEKEKISIEVDAMSVMISNARQPNSYTIDEQIQIYEQLLEAEREKNRELQVTLASRKEDNKRILEEIHMKDTVTSQVKPAYQKLSGLEDNIAATAKVLQEAIAENDELVQSYRTGLWNLKTERDRFSGLKGDLKREEIGGTEFHNIIAEEAERFKNILNPPPRQN